MHEAVVSTVDGSLHCRTFTDQYDGVTAEEQLDRVMSSGTWRAGISLVAVIPGTRRAYIAGSRDPYGGAQESGEGVHCLTVLYREHEAMPDAR